MKMHIVAKGEMSSAREHGLRWLAAGISIVASAIIILCLGYNPVDVFAKLLKGSLGSAYRFRETITKAIPLTMLSLGTAVAFRMKFWNIGAEGQFYMGAFGASIIALNCQSLPAPVMLPLMFIFGALFGAAWASIPALLKNKFGASETLVTLMLNYVAAKWVSYLQYGPWKDPKGNGFPKIATFVKAAVLPKVFGIHMGWIIVLITAILLYVMFRHTKLGYEIDVLGESQATARYAGINTKKVIYLAVGISGALCGIAGMMQASAVERSLSDQLSAGLGFTAVITTWLSQLNPLMMVLVSFLFSMLIQGGSFLQSALKIPASMSQILQGIIIFFVLGSEFFIRYRIVFTRDTNVKKAKNAQEAK